MNKINSLKRATILFAFLLIVWGFYRLFFRFPDWVEEIIVKPVVWIVPVIYLLKKEKRNMASIGLTFQNFFSSIYMSLALGSLFVIEALATNYFKYGHLNFAANLGQDSMFLSLGLSFATAISEEIAFRGYIFTRIQESLKKEWSANLTTSIAWTIMHIPIIIFVNKLTLIPAIVYLLLTFIYGVGSAFIYARTKNIASSVFLHVLWEWPISLFR